MGILSTVTIWLTFDVSLKHCSTLSCYVKPYDSTTHFYTASLFKTLSIKRHKINDKLHVKATERQTNKSIIIKEDLLCGEHTLNSFIGFKIFKPFI